MSATGGPVKYEALGERLGHELIDALRAHDRLPGERELAGRFGVSRMTLRRALDELEVAGRIYRLRGAGTFVAEPTVTKELTLTSFSEDMRARGLEPGSRVLEQRERPAGAEVGRDLGLSPVEPVAFVRRVRLAGRAPMCLEEVVLPARLVGGLLDAPLEGSLYEALRERHGIEIVRADQQIRATVLDPEDAELLEVPPLSPALDVERVAFDQRGRPVERTRSLYRADRYAFHHALTRRGAR